MNENLLVVEDEPDIRKNLEYNLGREGFKVSAVGSLNDANQKIDNNNFEAHGKLSIKNVSTDFILPFTLLGIMDSPRREDTLIAGFESEFSILRNDYNVGAGDWLSDAVVADEIKVKINLEVTTQKN